MKLLNKICSYWHDCIKNEDVLENDISLDAHSKAFLYPFDSDQFIFQRKDVRAKIADEKINTFASAKTEELDLFYGYPLLFYRDPKTNKDLVAPLLIIRVRIEHDGDSVYLSKNEPHPVCGVQALTKLGLRTEEIANINQTVEDLFTINVNVNEQKLAAQVLKIIKKETDISINEDIEPSRLSNSKKLANGMVAGLYNKSIIFTGETTVFNIHLIKDLLELKSRNDLEKTALSFFSEPCTVGIQNEIVPILPFPANEYQIKSIQEIFKQSLSV